MRINKITKQRDREETDETFKSVNFNGNAKPNKTQRDISNYDMSITRGLYFGDNFTLGLTSIQSVGGPVR